eukprot:COSAG02_NODE_2684_length_8241_cov_14.362442_7_plen_89_part_00
MISNQFSEIRRQQYVRLLSMLELRDVSVRDLCSFFTGRGFSHAALLVLALDGGPKLRMADTGHKALCPVSLALRKRHCYAPVPMGPTN